MLQARQFCCGSLFEILFSPSYISVCLDNQLKNKIDSPRCTIVQISFPHKQRKIDMNRCRCTGPDFNTYITILNRPYHTGNTLARTSVMEQICTLPENQLTMDAVNINISEE